MGQKDITKRVLADSLKELMRKRTISKITVGDICEKAQVSRRNFYRHFLDKYELLNWSYYHSHLLNRVYHDDWVIWDYFPEICRILYEDREFYLNAYDDNGQNSFRQYCYEQLYPLIMRDFEDVFESEEFAKFYIGHVTNMVFDYFKIWLSQNPCMPPDEFADRVRRMAGILGKRHWEIASGKDGLPSEE